MTDSDASASGVEAVVRAEGPAMLRLAYGLTGDRAAAEDLVQESFVRLLSAWETVTGSPGAFLRRTLINLHTDTYRRRRTLDQIHLRLTGSLTVATDGADPEGADLKVDFARALWSLPPLHRQVVGLRHVADLPMAEIAAILGRRPGSIRRIAAEAQALLRQSLADYNQDKERRPDE